MRQAGRYMSEYRALRERYSLLEICRTPELATEVTLQPVRRIEVDAAILFSDLLLPLEPIGIPFDFVRGEGPAIEKPLRPEADLDARAHASSRATSSRTSSKRSATSRQALPDAVAADWICRRAVHAGVVRDRGRPLEQLRAHQVADVRRSRRVASLLRPARRRHRRLSRRADRRGRRLRPAVRFVGRRAQRRRLSRVHPAAHAEDLRPPRASARRADDSFRRRHRRDPRRAARSGRRRDRRRLADAARRGVGANRPRPRHPGQSRSDAAARAGRSDVRRDRRGARHARAGGPGHIFNLGHGILPTTPVEHVQALARHVHQRTRM